MDKQYPSVKIFNNPLLEKYFTHIHPATPFVFWVPIIGYMSWKAFTLNESLTALQFTGLFAIGLFVWSFVEYILHRFMFHWEGESKLSKRFHFILHGIHHTDPQDPTRLVMPPVVSSGLAALFYYGFKAILGGHWVNPFFAGFLSGYLIYDYTHFAIHHFKMRSGWGKFLKHHHMQHHYVDHDAKLGVSSPIWDYVFGTIENEKNKEEASAEV